jgi:hypothetical protein
MFNNYDGFFFLFSMVHIDIPFNMCDQIIYKHNQPIYKNTTMSTTKTTVISEFYNSSTTSTLLQFHHMK